MKRVSIITAFAACLMAVSGCKEQDGREITDYKEYTVTVASEKIPGLITSCGNTVCADVFAVKKEGSSEWEPLPYIGDFEYETGNEYKIRIRETSYLDYSMGEPAWTEYRCLEVLSKEIRSSAGLPETFIPDWYYENNKYNISLSYFIDADNRETVGNDLETNPLIPSGAFLFNNGMTGWQLLDNDNRIVAQGSLQRKSKDHTEFPETYKNLKPEGQVVGYEEWEFIYDFGSDKTAVRYDVFILNPVTKSEMYARYKMALYKDMTAYYQDKFPDAGVRSVVYSLTLEQKDL